MKRFLLIGNPVSHSCSPTIHRCLYDFLHEDAEYSLLCLQHSKLGCFVDAFKNDNRMRGFNVTLPFKTYIIDFLDEISDEARFTGAVNTVAKVDKKLCGYNTDGMGFFLQLKRYGVNIQGKRVKILGAGGAAKAIAYTLNKLGAMSVIVYNRTLGNAEKITEGIGNGVFAELLSNFDAGCCDVLIQASSVGLLGKNEDSIVTSLPGIGRDTRVFDIIYNPLKTKFMSMAEENGCVAVNGCEMLIYQAFLAEQIWLGVDIIHDDSLFRRIYSTIVKEIQGRFM